MSPEQARGELEQLGPRSDVYSLGGTLYCLLTGQAPVQGDDIGAVLRSVQKAEFRRPSQLDSTIDPAIEAVCMKAMALNPDDRYASCRELADDVERWMADEPTMAWREPPIRRARRWAKRHRTSVTAAAVAVLVALAGTSAVLAVQTQANTRLTLANAALADANKREQGALRSRQPGHSHVSLGRERRSALEREPIQRAAYQASCAAQPVFTPGSSCCFRAKTIGGRERAGCGLRGIGRPQPKSRLQFGGTGH